jgi:hypothetical protein
MWKWTGKGDPTMQPARRRTSLFMCSLFGIVALIVPTAAQATNLDSMDLAHQLGSVLAAEEFCGLTYKQDAIVRFVEKKVRADDMAFASTLEMMTAGQKVTQQGMSVSAKIAHCTQIRRVAKSQGFIED